MIDMCFHGTTKTGLKNILLKKEKREGPWTCSYDNYTYFYSAEKIALNNDEENNNENFLKSIGKTLAFESGKIQTLFEPETDIYILEFQINRDLLEDDKSVDGNPMAMPEAKRIRSEILCLNDLKSIWVRSYSLWEKPYLLASLLDNKHFWTDRLYDFDPHLLAFAETIQRKNLFTDFFYENSDTHEFKEIPIITPLPKYPNEKNIIDCIPSLKILF